MSTNFIVSSRFRVVPLKVQRNTALRSPKRLPAGICRVVSQDTSKTDVPPDSAPKVEDSPFGLSQTKATPAAGDSLPKPIDKFAKDDNPWQPSRMKQKVSLTDVVSWDEFMALYDQDTCYQRLFRTLVTPLLYRKNIIVTDEQFRELAKIMIPMLLEDGYVHGLDYCPPDHKAWKIVDKWVQAVVDADRRMRLKGESVKPAKINGQHPWERALRLTPDVNIAIPANKHRVFRDDYRLPASIRALPDR